MGGWPGIGRKAFTCFFGVLFSFSIGLLGSLVAWVAFMLVMIAMLRKKSGNLSKAGNSDNVIIDVDADS